MQYQSNEICDIAYRMRRIQCNFQKLSSQISVDAHLVNLPVLYL